MGKIGNIRIKWVQDGLPLNWEILRMKLLLSAGDSGTAGSFWESLSLPMQAVIQALVTGVRETLQ